MVKSRATFCCSGTYKKCQLIVLRKLGFGDKVFEQDTSYDKFAFWD